MSVPIHFNGVGRFFNPRTGMLTTLFGALACSASSGFNTRNRAEVTCKRCLAFLKARVQECERCGGAIAAHLLPGEHICFVGARS